VGKPGFPTPPPAGGPGPYAGVWGNPVSPYPARGRVWQPSQEQPYFHCGVVRRSRMDIWVGNAGTPMHV